MDSNLIIRLVTEDTIHIGAGTTPLRPTRIAQTLIRDKILTIPASSIKGVLRKSCQRLLDAYRKVYQCPLTLNAATIFGAPNQSSKVFVSDAKAISEVKLSVLPGIALKEKTKTVDEGKLFFYEVIPPGTELEFHIFVISELNVDERRLLLFSIKELENSGLGRKSHSVRILSLKPTNFEIPPELETLFERRDKS